MSLFGVPLSCPAQP